ncbi:hypothetical protein ACEPPN_009814 [Leptodophora sp. 'Broadleaf-Isolate-01']
MEIIVRSLSGDIAPLTVSPETTTSNVKLQIRDALGTPLHQQRLLFKSEILVNSSTINESGISNMSLVFLVLAVSKKTIGNIYNTRQIFIKIFGEDIITLDANPYSTVHQIKSTIQETEGSLTGDRFTI